MGEICKDPGNSTRSTIEGSEKILRFLVETEGAAHTVRVLQYALEKLAAEIERNQLPGGNNTAAKYLKCADELETAYEKIKNDIRI